MHKYVSSFLLFGIFSFFFCTSADAKHTHEMLLGVLWKQASVESKMATEQAFHLAKLNVEKALRDPYWTAALEQKGDVHRLPPAIIVDVDETVLDNAPFAARLVKSKKEYNSKLWEIWVKESNADAMPGAKSFIRYVKEKGIAVFYVTNRVLKAAAVKNIKSVVDPDVTSDHVLCKNERPDWGSDKTSRRERIVKKYRVLQLVGDDYNDFTFLGKISAADRISAVKKHRQYWGSKWILISNPLYGSWKRTLLDNDYSMTAEDKLKKKYQYLNTKALSR